MTYQGHVENGTIVLDEAAELGEGMKVQIVIGREMAPRNQAAGKTLHERLQPFIGMADGLPADGSENLDHYLYGAPKT